ncbi:hypothetical protein E4U61_003595 [Claviceps capensis]|nr:hypothetical protein E4U61_003595 [Claviceps capensis]
MPRTLLVVKPGWLERRQSQDIFGCRADETHKDEASFSRFLNQLEALFESKGIRVKLWETDDDGSFINALNVGFLEARIIMYILHMNKDVPQEKLFMFRVTPSAECSVDNHLRISPQRQVADDSDQLQKLHASYSKNKGDVVKAEDALAKCKRYELLFKCSDEAFEKAEKCYNYCDKAAAYYLAIVLDPRDQVKWFYEQWGPISDPSWRGNR